MKKLISLILILSLSISFSACTNSNNEEANADNLKSTATAYLYGETHGELAILEKEFELWNNYYQNDGMRHLFIEFPFYGAEYLNLWMQAEDNSILDEIFNDVKGTAMDTPETKEFFIKIKENCPETIFHGIDVGHQYQTTGERYLNYLNENNLEDSQAFILTQEAIEQGKEFYSDKDYEYRENMLVENFKREFNSLKNEDIMGIFGAAHTDLDSYISNDTLNMTSQLIEYYGENIKAESLTHLALINEPVRIDTLTINNKDYEAEYYGKQDLSSLFPEYSHREYWKLVNAFEDFKDNEITGNVLPFDNYIMSLELNNIYVVDYTKKDGSVIREIHTYAGYEWQGKLATQQIIE